MSASRRISQPNVPAAGQPKQLVMYPLIATSNRAAHSTRRRAVLGIRIVRQVQDKSLFCLLAGQRIDRRGLVRITPQLQRQPAEYRLFGCSASQLAFKAKQRAQRDAHRRQDHGSNRHDDQHLDQRVAAARSKDWRLEAGGWRGQPSTRFRVLVLP